MKHGILTIVTAVHEGQADALRTRLRQFDQHPDDFPCHQLPGLHFASMAIIDNSTDGPEDFVPHLVFEASFDGAREDFVDEMLAVLPGPLDEVYGHCVGYPRCGTSLPRVVRNYLLDHDFGAALLYLAYPFRSVGQIAQEGLLHAELRRELAAMRPKISDGVFPPPTQRSMVNELRRLIRARPDLTGALTVPERPFVIAYGGILGEYALMMLLLLTLLGATFWFYDPATRTFAGSNRLGGIGLPMIFAGASIAAGLVGVWRQRWKRIAGVLLATALVVMVASRWHFLADAIHQAGLILRALGVIAFLAVLGIAGLVGLTAVAAQLHEWVESKPHPPRWDPAREKQLRRREERGPQNHMVGLTRLKPGPIRRLILKLVLWTIDLTKYLEKSGTLSGVSTIHFARWTLIDNQRQLLFLTHYDGDWDAYLGDFVSQASSGVTAIWSNCVGFPRSFLLFGGGSRDDRAFKAYARNHQHETLYLYSAYPTLTVTDIENNTALRQELGESLDAAGVDAFLRRI